MKRSVLVVLLIIFVTGFAAAQASAGGTLYVSVNSVTLKSGTSLSATNKGTLKYGDKVTVIKIDGKYAEVKSAVNSSLTGWTATANLSAKQVVTGVSSTATAKEISLAGKGFGQDIENTYKTSGKANYADVDKVETQSVKEADLKKFIEEGHLATGE